MLTHFPEETFHYAELKARFEQPTLWDAFLHFLTRNEVSVPSELLNRDVTQPIEPSQALQATLIDAYRNNHQVMQLCERLVDFDEGFQEWRYRHMRMVQRTIGSKPGTGGSPGVKYLSTTIEPLFPDLWEIRSAL
jgi:tryptophan 2,3-dioxygenase